MEEDNDESSDNHRYTLNANDHDDDDIREQAQANRPQNRPTASSYSALLHPNADPSEVSVLGDRVGGSSSSAASLGAFKRMIVWIDQNWLKPLLVNKSFEEI